MNSTALNQQAEEHSSIELPTPAMSFRLFFSPLRNHPILFFIVIAVLSVAGQRYEAFCRTVQQNLDGLHYLEDELKGERGPHFANSKESHAEAMRFCIRVIQRRIEHHRIAPVLISFFPNLDTKPELQTILEALLERTDDEIVADTMIEEASESIRSYRRRILRFSTGEIGSGSEVELTHEELEQINESFRLLTQAADDLEEAPSFANAEAACMASRFAGLLLAVTWSEYAATNNQKNVEQFNRDLLRVRRDMLTLRSGSTDTVERLYLREYSHSVDRRLKLFDELRGKKLVAVSQL